MARSDRVFVWAFVVLVAAAVPRPAEAIGEASTAFAVFVPPNNDTIARAAFIAITALEGSASDPTHATLVDDATDGDSDDSLPNVPLVRGQTLVRYLKDGTVNDDAGGKWDGDYLRVTADRPVLVHMGTDSDWQHDFVPADDKSMRGTEFFFWVNRSTSSPRDVNVFSYEDGTRVTLRRVSTTKLLASGTTGLVREDDVGPEAAGNLAQPARGDPLGAEPRRSGERRPRHAQVRDVTEHLADRRHGLPKRDPDRMPLGSQRLDDRREARDGAAEPVTRLVDQHPHGPLAPDHPTRTM